MKKIVFLISLALFLVSLTQPPYRTAGSSDDGLGLLVLIFGFFAIGIDWPAWIAWLANPLLIASWILFFINVRFSRVLGIVSSMCAMSFLFVHKVVINEAGGKGVILSYEKGYWFWLSSCIVFCIGVWMYEKKSTDAADKLK